MAVYSLKKAPWWQVGRWGWEVFPPLLTLLLLIPVLQSGFSSDDLLNACIGGHDSLWGYLKNDLRVWIFERGRLCPGTILWVDLVHGLLPKWWAVKILVVVLTMVDVWLLARLVRGMTGSRFVAIGFSVLFPVFIQVRNYHDPLLHFAGLIPAFLAILLLSFLAVWKHRERGGRGWLLAATLLYLVALWTYEIAFVLYPLYLCLLKGETLWERFTKSWPFLLVWTLTLLLSMYLRQLDPGSTMVYPGTTFGIQAGVVGKTLGQQLVATLPLSYAFWDPSGLFTATPILGAPGGLQAWDVFVGAAFVGALMAMVRMPQGGRVGWDLFLFGAGLFLLPALPIALSHKYQLEFASPHYGWGMGYIPVLIQAFGAALVSGWILTRVMDHFGPGGRWWVLAMAGSLLLPVVVLQNRANRLVVSRINGDCHQPREAVIEALEKGLLHGVRPGTKIHFLDGWNRDSGPGVHSIALGWMSGAYLWFNSDFVRLHTGKRHWILEDPESARTMQVGDGLVWLRSTESGTVKGGEVLYLERTAGAGPQAHLLVKKRIPVGAGTMAEAVGEPGMRIREEEILVPARKK